MVTQRQIMQYALLLVGVVALCGIFGAMARAQGTMNCQRIGQFTTCNYSAPPPPVYMPPPPMIYQPYQPQPQNYASPPLEIYGMPQRYR